VPFTSELFPPRFPTKTGLKPKLRDDFYGKVCHTKFEKIVDLQPLKHSKTDEYSTHISLKKIVSLYFVNNVRIIRKRAPSIFHENCVSDFMKLSLIFTDVSLMEVLGPACQD